MSEKIDTGGSAFARPYSVDDRTGYESESEGMTLLDYFAAKAMQALITQENSPKLVSAQAYEQAQSMLEEKRRIEGVK